MVNDDGQPEPRCAIWFCAPVAHVSARTTRHTARRSHAGPGPVLFASFHAFTILWLSQLWFSQSLWNCIGYSLSQRRAMGQRRTPPTPLHAPSDATDSRLRREHEQER